MPPTASASRCRLVVPKSASSTVRSACGLAPVGDCAREEAGRARHECAPGHQRPDPSAATTAPGAYRRRGDRPSGSCETKLARVAPVYQVLSAGQLVLGDGAFEVAGERV